MMKNRYWAAAALCAAVVVVVKCIHETSAQSSGVQSSVFPNVVNAQVLYQGGLQNGWKDYGWAQRVLKSHVPAQVNMGNWAGWVLAKPGLTGSFGGVALRIQASEEVSAALELAVMSQAGVVGSPVLLSQCAQRVVDGWREVFCPMGALNPSLQNIDRVRIKAVKSFSQAWVQIASWVLTASDAATPTPQTLRARLKSQGPAVSVQSRVRCDTPKTVVSPWIFGIAQGPDADPAYMASLGATTRRWGGNTSSRYNPLHGYAWNTASDWYYRNVNKSQQKDTVWDRFLKDNQSMSVGSAFTVPMLGHVAKDVSSYSYPVSLYGTQRAVAPENPDAGDGYTVANTPLTGKPSLTSVPTDAAFITAWMKKMTASQGFPSMHLFFLDNEPMLWHVTHRDVHPNPVSYDELLQRTLYYGSALRSVDPHTPIAGPSLWGWPAYFYSAVDAQAGFRLAPDRKKHGDVPLLEWYVKELTRYRQQTGVRLLNHIDVHYYPQASGVFQNGQNEKTDPDTAALRIRSTRSLWDSSYTDESWINDKVALIPRLKAIAQAHDPSLGVVIGEYNFGAMDHMSGGLAQAEALGRFAQHGVHAAFFWTHPPEGSFAHAAFRAFRKNTPEGFLPLYVQSETTPGMVSVFASSNVQGNEHVWVVLNRDPQISARVVFDVSSCGKTVQEARVYSHASFDKAFVQESPELIDGASMTVWLPPYSIQTVHVTYR